MPTSGSASGSTASSATYLSLTACSIRRVDMYDLPGSLNLHEDDCSSPHRAATPVKFECDNCRVASHLSPDVRRNDVQIRRPARLLARRVEHRLESGLNLLPSVEPVNARRLWDVRVEDRYILGKRTAEALPVEVVERCDETRERLLDIRARVAATHR